MKNLKIIIFSLVALLCLTLAGCGENPDFQNQGSDVSADTSSDSEIKRDEGIELPEDDFDTDTEQGGFENNSSNNTNKEDDAKTSSSTETDNQNQSSSPQSSNKDTTSSTDDNTSSDEENTSSDDSSEPSENSDGSIELPFDKW